MSGRKKHLQQPLDSEAHLKKILRRSRERSPSLGDICKFDVSGVEIMPSELLRLLQEVGFEDWQPVDINKRKAAKKAITRMKHLLEDPANDLKVMVRRVPTIETNVTRYALIDESPDGTGLDLDYSTRNQVIFRENTNTIEFTRDVNEDILQEFEYMCSVYTDSEIALMVRNIVTNYGCVWFRDNSGMFFMPHPYKDIVDSLVKLFDGLQDMTDDTCYFRPIAIMNDEENRAAMGEALIADISLELEDAFTLLDKIASQDEPVQKGKRPRKTLGAALKKFKIAKGKADIYKEMLQINLTDITTRIDEANKKANEILMGIAAVSTTAEETETETETIDNIE